MGKRDLIILLLVLFISSACDMYPYVDGIFVNDSDYRIKVTEPRRPTPSYTCENVDTTMFSWLPFVYSTGLREHSTGGICVINTFSYEDWFPKGSDTLCIFVYRYLTYPEYTIEELDYEREHLAEFYKNNEYYVRYDLSKQDIQHLLNSDGVLLLYFPPDERMKKIKMWPPYEEVVEKYSPKD